MILLPGAGMIYGPNGRCNLPDTQIGSATSIRGFCARPTFTVAATTRSMNNPLGWLAMASTSARARTRSQVPAVQAAHDNSNDPPPVKPGSPASVRNPAEDPTSAQWWIPGR